jgi:hypothetical protein
VKQKDKRLKERHATLKSEVATVVKRRDKAVMCSPDRDRLNTRLEILMERLTTTEKTMRKRGLLPRLETDK